MLLHHVLRDRLEQVRFPQARRSVDEERVVRLRRRLRPRRAPRRGRTGSTGRSRRGRTCSAGSAPRRPVPGPPAAAALVSGSGSGVGSSGARRPRRRRRAARRTSSCSAAAAFRRLPKWPSIQVLVNSLGTPTTSRSRPGLERPRVPPNHVSIGARRSAPRAGAARWFPRSGGGGVGGHRAGECTPLAGRGQPSSGGLNSAKLRGLQGFSRSTQQLRPQLWKAPPPSDLAEWKAAFPGGLCRYGRPRLGAFPHPASGAGGVERCLYTAAADEAHLSAQHPQAREDARIPQAHEHPSRPCRAQAPPGAWAQASVRIASVSTPPIRPRPAGVAACRAPRSSTP